MPDYRIRSEQTEATSSSLLADFQAAMDMLNKIRAEVDGLLADGYQTPAAEQQFKPFFDQFHTGFNQTCQGLQGISQYVKGVGDAFSETDSSLGRSLTQSG
ncbi:MULTISPECIES: WXG100 family type VII secretion target [unclassified Streptomyces]|uniref:WXG100 family type VII secretion target n=1 Tax=unclassified Streptomyces TaxID=2593676 RepID=UPI0037D43A66